jgi:hypothetical protein
LRDRGKESRRRFVARADLRHLIVTLVATVTGGSRWRMRRG